MRNIISSFFKMAPINALVLYLLFWLPFLEYSPKVMIAYFSFGIALCLVNLFSKLNLFRIRYLYLFSGLATLVISTGTWKGIETGGGFLGLLALTKVLALKKVSDYFLYFLILQLFLCAQLLSAESLYLAIYLLILCPLLFLFMHYSMRSKNESKKFDRYRRRVILKIFLTALPIAIVLFVVFPRLQLGNIFFSTKLDLGQSGYVEKLSPGEISKLIQSDEIIFRANFLEKDPAPSTLYWRGAILTKGSLFNWEKGPRRPRLYSKKSSKKPDYKVEYDKLQKGAVFTLDGTSKVKALSKASIFAYEGNVFEMVPYSNQKLRYQGSIQKNKYIKNPYTKKLLETYLTHDLSSSDKLKKLIKKIKTNSENNNNKIVSNLINFYKENNFKYSLSPGIYTSQNPLDDFIFSRRLGFCEHYAGASATILRMARVPTRIITGFQGAEYSNLGKYYIIRSRDAHAWLEYWSNKENRWTRFDPVLYVAPERIEFGNTGFMASLKLGSNQTLLSFLEGQNASYIKKLLLTYDFAYYRLNNLFLTYDIEKQLRIFKEAGIKAKNAGTLLVYSIGLVFLLFFLFMYLNQLKFLRQHPADKAIRPLVKKLAKKGQEKAINETIATFLRRVGKNNIYKNIAKEYELIKYSPNKSKDDLKNFKKLIKTHL